MSRTATLRKQHDAIVQLAGDLDAAIGSIEGGDAGLAVRLLKHFDGLLTAHLNSEDTFLYPGMIASSDSATAETARRFSQEMGGLIGTYSDFAKRWIDEAAIRNSPGDFRSDWRALLGALSARIERENAQLYPLADAMDGSGTRAAA